MGFGPKLPFSAHALELADLEAAFVGNLARYCMYMGTVPRFPLRGLWWVNGECKGLSVTGWGNEPEQIKPLINHLAQYAPFIVGTEGVQDLLEAGAATRWYSKKMFPQEIGEWITLQEAASLVGRTERTIQRWITGGSVRAIGDQNYMEVLKTDVQTMREIIEENRKSRAANLRQQHQP